MGQGSSDISYLSPPAPSGACGIAARHSVPVRPSHGTLSAHTSYVDEIQRRSVAVTNDHLLHIVPCARWQTSSMRGFLAMTVTVLLAIGVGVAIVAHEGVSKAKSGSGTSIALPASRPQTGELHLAGGRSSAGFTIIALPPPTHTYDVLIETNASADLSVHFQTWYGQTLGVQYSTRGTLASDCNVTGIHLLCLQHFPALEAQCPGPWKVIASKSSGPPVSVRIVVTFQAVRGDLTVGSVTRC